MRYFVAAHDFHAEEEVEVSIHKGEIVCATEGLAQDGWMKVEVAADARRRGFAPESYLREITGTEATAAIQAAAAPMSSPGASPPPSAISPVQTSQPPERRRMSTSARHAEEAASSSPQQGENEHRTTRKDAHPSPPPVHRDAQPLEKITALAESRAAAAASHTALAPAQQPSEPVRRNLLDDPNAAVDAFMKNEVYFQQLMQRRASALAQMQAGLEEAVTEVAACKDCTTVLTRKLRDLDEAVERERQRWVERVEEEKVHISHSVPYTAPLAHPPSSDATPVRSPLGRRRDRPVHNLPVQESPRSLRG